MLFFDLRTAEEYTAEQIKSFGLKALKQLRDLGSTSMIIETADGRTIYGMSRN